MVQVKTSSELSANGLVRKSDTFNNNGREVHVTLYEARRNFFWLKMYALYLGDRVELVRVTIDENKQENAGMTVKRYNELVNAAKVITQ